LQGKQPGHKTNRVKMNPEIVQTQSWRYKTIVVIKRQQQTNIKQTNEHGRMVSDKSILSSSDYFVVFGFFFDVGYLHKIVSQKFGPLVMYISKSRLVFIIKLSF